MTDSTTDEKTPLLNSSNKSYYVEESGSCELHNVDFQEYYSWDKNDHQPVELGSLNLLSQKYESLDYEVCENSLFIEEEIEAKNGYWLIKKTNIYRWFIIVAIGAFTAMTGCFITILINLLSGWKFSILKFYVDKCSNKTCMIIPYILWIIFNAIPVLIGSLLVTYIAPVAAGSGIPVIKCYLNGVKIPEVVRIKTLIVKAVGVILSVVGGLAVGKEGPMIHCGSVIAAGISQGKSTTFRKDFKVFERFREDHEKRDFVSAGAAAGVATAFGAPIGGVLFSLEEGASFWNQYLTWRIFVCSMISVFILNFILSIYHRHFGELSYPGLLNFGKFQDINYDVFELPIYMVMGVLGGLLGALYNHINSKLAIYRIRYLHHKYSKVLESVIVAIMSATVGFLMIYFSNDCQEYGENIENYNIQYHCPDGEFSTLGALWFQTPEASVRSMFHNVPGTWSIASLSTFIIFYYLLGCWTYGLSISNGLFIPTLLIGASWGRLIGKITLAIFPKQTWINLSKFALIGAAAMLGGVVRMTISLTAILIESTGNLTLGLPLMLTLMVAKWVGDYFNEGLYDIHIRLASVPLLSWEPPPFSHSIYASKVMSYPVVTFNTIEKVGKIIDVLIKEKHNGFPVVDNEHERRFRGLILRWQLIVILQHKTFNETSERTWSNKLKMKNFRDAYPRYPPIHQVNISQHERNFTIDLRPYMNPSAYSVLHTASLPRIFRLFRALGLRHIVVVNDTNEVVGIVTRKDLARFHSSHGKIHLEEFQFSEG